jgi:hypothetical protein
VAQYYGASGGRRDRAIAQGNAVDRAIGTSESARDFAALATKLDRPSLRLRLRVSTQASVLDNELARGASPMDSCELALRARQLVQPKRREQFASALESLRARAQGASSVAKAAQTPRRETTDVRASFLALAQRLRDARPVYARGMAMLSFLLRDRTGPTYVPGSGPGLRRALRQVAVELDGTWTGSTHPTWAS